MSPGSPTNARNNYSPTGANLRRYLAAEGYLTLDMPDHALAELGQIPREAECLNVYRLRADILCRLKRFAEATDCYTLALGLAPASLGLLLGLAHCFRKTGDYEGAIQLLEPRAFQYREEPAILFALARVCALAGRAERCLLWLELAARVCPKFLAGRQPTRIFAAC